jgi:hypothetical protein
MHSTFDIEAYSTTITELLALGADPSSYCPTVEAITYHVCASKKRSFVVPDESYVEIVRQGLRAWGYDDAILLAAARNL